MLTATIKPVSKLLNTLPSKIYANGPHRRVINATNLVRIAPDSIGLSLKQDNRKVTLGEDNMKVSEFSIRANDVVYVKNLGRQIRWDLVFYIEYLGPIIIVPAFYLLGKRQSYTWVQPVAAGMAIAHFLKR